MPDINATQPMDDIKDHTQLVDNDSDTEKLEQTVVNKKVPNASSQLDPTLKDDRDEETTQPIESSKEVDKEMKIEATLKYEDDVVERLPNTKSEKVPSFKTAPTEIFEDENKAYSKQSSTHLKGKQNSTEKEELPPTLLFEEEEDIKPQAKKVSSLTEAMKKLSKSSSSSSSNKNAELHKSSSDGSTSSVMWKVYKHKTVFSVGLLNSFQIIPVFDSDGKITENFIVTLEGKIGTPTLEAYITKENSNYIATFFPVRTGCYLVNVVKDGKHIKDSPFSIIVE